MIPRLIPGKPYVVFFPDGGSGYSEKYIREALRLAGARCVACYPIAGLAEVQLLELLSVRGEAAE